MKKYGLSLAVIFVFFWTATCYAMVQLEVLSPTTCIRGTGAPITEAFTFLGFSGPATIKLTNGGLEDDSIEKVSSSIVTVNGQVVFGSSEFNQNVGYLEKETTLVEEQNTLGVCLKGKPGGQLTIQITQEVEADGAGVVGLEGGVVEVTDPESEIYGAKVEILDGVLEQDSLITISVSEVSQTLPDDLSAIGSAVDLGPDGLEFNGPVMISLPVETYAAVENESVGVAYFNLSQEAWELVPPLGYDAENNKVYFFAHHFSTYHPVKVSLNHYTIGTSFNMQTDSMVYKNNDFEYCPHFSGGICAALALYSEWYFEKQRHGLRCDYDFDTGERLCCNLFDEYEDILEWNKWWNLITKVGQSITLGGAKTWIILELATGKPVTLAMFPDNGNGHAVLIVGYTAITSTSGYFTVYDVNDNSDFHQIWCYEELLRTKFEYLEKPEYTTFFIWHKQGLTFDNLFAQYPPTDSDGDGIGNLCDNCPNTPSGEPVNENGCSFSQLNPALSLPTNSAVDVDPNNITFEWQPVTHPGGYAVKYCVTVKKAAEPEDIPVFMGCDDEIFTSETSFILPISLQPGKTYYWAVWSRDDHGNWSEASVWWTFTTTPDPSDVDDDGDDYTENQGDCNDNDSSIYPGATEVCGDGIDNNCDGQVDEGCGPIDSDGDGVPDDQDPFPNDPNEWSDSDQDSIGDNADTVDNRLPANVSAEYELAHSWNYITWDAVPGATEYRVYWGTEPYVTNTSELLTPTNTTDYGHTGVVPGYTYYYRVAAVTAGVESELSEQVSVSVPLAGTGKIPDTGQTTSYTDTFGEDSDYTINPQSYTKLNANGIALDDSATEWTMVQDNVTGLMWEVKTDDGGIHDKDDTYNWQEAQDNFIAQLNNENFGGHSDWRLPTVLELTMLVNADKPFPEPAINTEFFQNTIPHYYRAFTHSAVDPEVLSWIVCFGGGSVYVGYKHNDYYVRAVRGGSETFQELVDNSDGTVTDTRTGLMWQQADAGTMTWTDALSYCENLQLANNNDWRLPNRNELQSLVDYSKLDPAIDTVKFPDTNSYYWSSTTMVDNNLQNHAWSVNFAWGHLYSGVYFVDKSTGNYVRAVRNIQ